MICERCGKPRATEVESDIADARDHDPTYTSRFCWDDLDGSGIPCEDTRLERTLAKLARLRDAAKETRDACAALLRLAADMGVDTAAVDYLHLAGVRDGFGVRVDAAIAESEAKQ